MQVKSLYPMTDPLPEYWLRGPVEGIIPALQPVVHALLQAREEVVSRMEHFSSMLLWATPYHIASPGFHLKHLSGVLDRLFTYARGGELDATQLAYLAEEKVKPAMHADTTSLLQNFSAQIEKAIAELRNYTEADLLAVRFVGRKKIASNVLGLLFHAAEHTTRHTGQLLVISMFLEQGSKNQTGD